MNLISYFAEHQDEISYDISKALAGTDIKELPPDLVKAIVTISVSSAQAVALQYNSWLESQSKRRPE